MAVRFWDTLHLLNPELEAFQESAEFKEPVPAPFQCCFTATVKHTKKRKAIKPGKVFARRYCNIGEYAIWKVRVGALSRSSGDSCAPLRLLLTRSTLIDALPLAPPINRSS